MRKANRPQLDEDGLITVTVAKAENKVFDDVGAMKKGLPPDQCRYEGYDFEFSCPGTVGDFRLRERCGAVLNPEPVETKYRGTVKIYNKLTSIVLGTGLAKVEELDDIDVDELKEQVLALPGTQYRAKLVKVDGYHRIDLSTLTPIPG